MPTADGLADVDSLRILGQQAGFTLTIDSMPTVKLSNVQYNKTNDDVKLVQQKLITLGFNPGPVDSWFYNQTRDAWAAYEATIDVTVVNGVPGCYSLTTLGTQTGTPQFATSCDISDPTA